MKEKYLHMKVEFISKMAKKHIYLSIYVALFAINLGAECRGQTKFAHDRGDDGYRRVKYPAALLRKAAESLPRAANSWCRACPAV
jgi:hypothetical protein